MSIPWYQTQAQQKMPCALNENSITISHVTVVA